MSCGPFIGDSKQDIARLFAEYHAGGFIRLSEWKKRSDVTGDSLLLSKQAETVSDLRTL